MFIIALIQGSGVDIGGGKGGTSTFHSEGAEPPLLPHEYMLLLCRAHSVVQLTSIHLRTSVHVHCANARTARFASPHYEPPPDGD